MFNYILFPKIPDSSCYCTFLGDVNFSDVVRVVQIAFCVGWFVDPELKVGEVLSRGPSGKGSCNINNNVCYAGLRHTQYCLGEDEQELRTAWLLYTVVVLYSSSRPSVCRSCISSYPYPGCTGLTFSAFSPHKAGIPVIDSGLSIGVHASRGNGIAYDESAESANPTPPLVAAGWDLSA